MIAIDLLRDGFGRVREEVHDVLDGISPQQLTYRPDSHANSVAWLVWHLTRIQDDHLAGATASDQVWLADGWHERFDLGLDRHDHGYGHSAAQVAQVQVDAGLLVGYHDAVYERTLVHLDSFSEADFGRIVDEHWDPPVTLAVRLISVLSDDLQHVGQAAYVRGLAERA